MSDANTHVDRAAATNLVRWFADPAVGVVVGRLVLVDSATAQNADGTYWRYETFLKRRESLLGALLGANGAIYAMRKDLFVAIPADTVIDDFVIPLMAKLRTDCRIVYDCDALAWEETAPDIASEFRRRVRIGAGGYQAIGMLWRLLDPRRGWISLTFFSHKILRWLCPFFLIGMLLFCILLSHQPFYRTCLVLQVVCYPTLAYLGLRSQVRMPKLLALASMFVTINFALLCGFLGWVSGTQKGSWIRTRRSREKERLTL
jgi:cellulose synthase/poly-beta-1,6-N-acetylglucosamine synthase-like glycosyltransferase